MVSTEVEIVNKLGLHARASAKLTQVASGFAAEVWLSRNGRRVNAKSIMGVMMLAAGKGSHITIDAEGADAAIVNKLGLHARASAKLTQLAGGFECEIWISRSGRRVNAKSIMGVMMLAAGIGSTVKLEAEGKDADAALAALLKLIRDKFGEGE